MEVHLICATRGGEGWQGKPPGASKDDLPRIRTAELEAAAGVLGVAGVELWDYPDGGVPDCDQAEITQRIAAAVRALRPAAVIGWGPDGGYGHPDHVAVGACTDAAVGVVSAADPTLLPALYHLALDEPLARAYREIVTVTGGDGELLPLVVQPDVGPVVRLTDEEVRAKMRAIECHASQLETWRVAIRELPELAARVYGREPYVAAVAGAPMLNGRNLLTGMA